MDDTVLVGDVANGARKKCNKRKERLNKKDLKYANKDPSLTSFRCPCKHSEKSFQCKQILKCDAMSTKDVVYKDNNKLKQDARIATLLHVNTPKRSRLRGDGGPAKKSRAVQITYQIRKRSGLLIPVCQKFFGALLQVGVRRILTIGKTLKAGLEMKENRGGDRRSHKLQENKIQVRAFIGGLRAHESHYNRAKSQRLYLSSALNINRLHKMYNKSVNPRLAVNYHLFYKIFVNEFNVGFGSPASDVCSLCTRLKNEFKAAGQEDKVKLMCDYRVHRLRAKQFTLLMREKPANTVSYCFDMQQVQVLPKVPIQEAFYSRQIAHYTLAIVDIETSAPVFYNWTENQSGRGSNEVGSAVTDFLSKLTFPEGTTTLRLFADGCGGQNKNCHIVHALTLWLKSKSPASLKYIQVIFPVRGHSYLPADRVFGLVEKVLRAHPTIITPDEYTQIYSEFGEVRILGKDWHVYNLKELLDYFKKIDGISEVKRFFFKKINEPGQHNTVTSTVKYKTEINFRCHDETKVFQSLLKRGKKFEGIELNQVPLEHAISDEKIKDVKSLIAKFAGESWRDNVLFEWYVDILDNPDRPFEAEGNANDDNENCNCEQDDVGMRL